MSMCDPSVSGVDYLTSFEFIKAFTCVYANAAGLLVAGLIVWAAVSISIYIRTGSVAIPTILLMLTGGATLTTMANPAYQVAGMLVLLAGPGIMAYAIYKYSR